MGFLTPGIGCSQHILQNQSEIHWLQAAHNSQKPREKSCLSSYEVVERVSLHTGTTILIITLLERFTIIRSTEKYIWCTELHQKTVLKVWAVKYRWEMQCCSPYGTREESGHLTRIYADDENTRHSLFLLIVLFLEDCIIFCLPSPSSIKFSTASWFSLLHL